MKESVLVIYYFDNAATTKPHKDVLDSFNKVNETVYFNPNSPLQVGVASEKVLLQAKERISSMLSIGQNRCYFYKWCH